jgi:hypothetical protein
MTTAVAKTKTKAVQLSVGLDLSEVECPTLLDFINKGVKSTVIFNKKPVYEESGYYYTITNGVIEVVGQNSSNSSWSGGYNNDFQAYSDGNPCAVILPDEQLIGNGDEDIHSIDVEADLTVSFACLAGLFKGAEYVENAETIEDVARMLGAGKIELIAFTKDSYKSLTTAEKAKIKDMEVRKAQAVLNRPVGFTLVGERWHRSATAVFKHKNKSWLVGQDEGSYFGVVLKDNPKTVDAAFTSLMPKEARGKKGVMRQGEWFAVPLGKDEEVPECAWDVVQFTSIILPKENNESNDHELSCGDGRLRGSEIFVHNFRLEHDQHAGIADQNGWYKIVRNTAERSVSVQGVD